MTGVSLNSAKNYREDKTTPESRVVLFQPILPHWGQVDDNFVKWTTCPLGPYFMRWLFPAQQLPVTPCTVLTLPSEALLKNNEAYEIRDYIPYEWVRPYPAEWISLLLLSNSSTWDRACFWIWCKSHQRAKTRVVGAGNCFSWSKEASPLGLIKVTLHTTLYLRS